MMPNYEYHCNSCNSVTIQMFPYDSRPEKIVCACGSDSHYQIAMPYVNGKASFLDGHKRKGWADLKESAKLNKQAAVAKGDTRKEIQKEIRKLGVRTEK